MEVHLIQKHLFSLLSPKSNEIVELSPANQCIQVVDRFYRPVYAELVTRYVAYVYKHVYQKNYQFGNDK